MLLAHTICFINIVFFVLLYYLLTEPIQSPTDVHITDISSTFITFSWSAVASDCRNIKYNLYAENCGICPFATFHTSASCNSPTIDGRICQFRAKSVVCGITAEDFSNLVTVTLKRKHNNLNSIEGLHALEATNNSIGASFDPDHNPDP